MVMALGESDQPAGKFLQPCYQMLVRWEIILRQPLRNTLGFGVVKLKNDPWVVNLLRAGATFYHTSTEHPSKIVLQLVDKMELFKIKPPILSNIALWPGSLESQALVPMLGS